MVAERSNTTDREIVISRDYDAPRELIWKAWTQPEHVAQWWGPDGFTTTIHEMDLRPGGVWKLTMHGPDGTEYPNKSVFKEVVELEKIVFSHGGGKVDGPGASFEATWTFETIGNKTRLTGRMVFPTAEARDRVIKEYNAVEGGKQTLGRLAKYLPTMTGANSSSREVTIEHTLDAPRTLVWEVWSNAEHVSQWWGPRGFTIPECQIDFRVGGTMRYVMRGPDGTDYPFVGVYNVIDEPHRIVMTGKIDPDSGQDLVTTVEFTESGGQTTVKIRQTVPVVEEYARGQVQGWTETLERLAEFVASQKETTA